MPIIISCKPCMLIRPSPRLRRLDSSGRPYLTVDGCIPTGPLELAFLLNNDLSPFGVERGHMHCTVCLKPTCNKIHLEILPTPAPSHEEAHQLDKQVHMPQSPIHPIPYSHQQCDEECPDLARCEVAVQVAKRGCGHVFGSICLEEQIVMGMHQCSICHAPWFKQIDPWYRRSVVEESWPVRKILALGWKIGDFEPKE
jgi:hypothetical protein